MQPISRRQVLKATLWASAACLGGAARAASPAITDNRASMDCLQWGAREAARRIRQRDIRVEDYFSRLIKHCNEHKYFNGIASLDAARMLEVGRGIDLALARGERLGPAAGVPFAVKDQIAVAGYPAASGNQALRSYIPVKSAVVVSALAQAGAVPFAKTTCPNMTGNSSLMAQVDSYSPAYGVVRNPYDPVRMAGGSSGGSAVVLAARMVPAALGEDTNGSVRVPAAFCGVAGLRPSTYTIDNALEGTTRKRYSDQGLVIGATRLDTIGPMARTVADVAFLDELVTGDAVSEVHLRDVRIAIPRGDYWDEEWVDSRVARVTQAAFAQLREAGAQLVEIDYLGLRSTVGSLGRLSDMALAAQELNVQADAPDSVAKWLTAHMPQLTLAEFTGVPVVNQNRRFWHALRISVAEQRKLLHESHLKYMAIFAAHNVAAIAAPTVPVLPQILTPGGSNDFETVEIRGKTLDRASVMITQSVIAPRYGAPGLSLPAGIADGLPVGLEFDGLPGRDSALLALGMAAEQALGPLPAPRMS
jgi:Asp-tRNA(Asn)/Glu-tRNA(Gln) amidotransferase A subunit family amidase